MRWLRENGKSVGAVVAPQTVFDLGVDWYAMRLEYDWQRADTEQTARTFARHGLTDTFWAVR